VLNGNLFNNINKMNNEQYIITIVQLYTKPSK